MDGATSGKLYLAAMGNAGDVATWSNIPHYFYQAGRAAGFFHGALDLHAERFRPRRLAWNLAQVLRGQRRGGFQYSLFCLDHAFGAVRAQVEDAEIISHFQVFPPTAAARKSRLAWSFYIDLPLASLFEEYGIAQTIGKAAAREALRREKEGYQEARYVVAMSSHYARVVREEYGIPAEKVKAILPGANIDDDTAERCTMDLDNRPVEAEFTPARPFRLGFTGKDYRRKGLDRLVKAAELLRADGCPVEVDVVGFLAPEYRQHSAVRWHGFIDKRHDMERFARTVMSYDLGCLPSYAEGLGISTLECLRLGVPVLGTAVGGITDCVPPGAGILLPGDVTPEGIAEAVRPLLRDPGRYASVRQEARRIRRHFTWKRTVEDFQAFWGARGS